MNPVIPQRCELRPELERGRSQISGFSSGTGLGDDPGVEDSSQVVRGKRRQLLETLAGIRDPQSRLQWVVDRARTRPSLPDVDRREEHRVSGCQVRLWWVAEYRDGRCWFRSDSDAVTLKALTGLLAECYSGERAAEVVGDPPNFLGELGLLRQLAENRRATVLRVAEGMLGFAREMEAREGGPSEVVSGGFSISG
jgi:cysteine desulfuration protein SufE